MPKVYIELPGGGEYVATGKTAFHAIAKLWEDRLSHLVGLTHVEFAAIDWRALGLERSYKCHLGQQADAVDVSAAPAVLVLSEPMQRAVLGGIAVLYDGEGMARFIGDAYELGRFYDLTDV